MGSRVGLLRPLRRTSGFGLAVLASTGCIEFVAPNIPGIEDRGSAALFSAQVVVSDSGTVRADARLRPGLDFDGLERPVPDPRLRILGQVLEPDTVLRDGTRRYAAAWQVDRAIHMDPITVTAPLIEDLVTSPPAVRWYGLRRDGPDAIDLLRGEDLHLPIAEVAGDADPVPSIRQWFLTLESGGSQFRFGSDGVPESPIWIPARWIPGGETVRVRLVYTQSGVVGTQNDDYVGVVTANSLLYWTVRVAPGGATGTESSDGSGP